MPLLIVVAGVVDRRELTPYLIVALAVAVIAPLVLVLASYIMAALNSPIGIGPNAMVAPGWWRRHYVEWSEVRALIHTHSMVGSFAPIDRNLIVLTKDNRRIRLFLPAISKEELAQLLAILRDIADRHGFELVLDHTEEGQKRSQELGA
ncbi:hypothetical protein [Nitratireductor sp. GCM10026969]|uniref:hypothetical protein n=1 Tax=Nitratireductor sp. GCM10026969 TaxID=3252645 RepID=UPI003621F879